jgi:hypothetical protein
MIATLDQLVNAFNTSQLLQLNKATIATQGTGGYSALWRATGTPGQGAIPAGAAVIDNTLTGAINFTQPTGGAASYFARLQAVAGNSNTDILIYDRLAHMGGLSGVTTGNQTVNVDVSGSSSNLANRRGASDYSDVTWWWEIYTDIGTTGQTCTVTYTNGGGTGSRTTTFSLGGASPLNQDSRTFQIIGSGGEFIQSIQTVSIGTSTGTAGSWGITARRLLTTVTLPLANNGVVYDWMQAGFPRIHDSACLEIVMICGTTSTGTLVGSFRVVQG